MPLFKNMLVQYVTAIILALLCNYFNHEIVSLLATNISDSFIFVIKWCCLPMIALSIISSTSELQNKKEFFLLGKNVLTQTILTTLLAASVALGLFLLINPTNSNLSEVSSAINFGNEDGLFGFLLVGTVLATLLLSIGILYFPIKHKQLLNKYSVYLYKMLMSIMQKVLLLMPIAIWAFAVLFLKDLNALTTKSIALYLICIISANLIQAIIVLPALLKYHGISTIKLCKAMWPALNAAFWSKSSAVALPIAIKCASERANLSEKMSKFALPVCITINMNACAAFILITVLFVSTSYGVTYTPVELIACIGIATLAAIGNAGVPMGCFTLSVALLAYLGVPLQLMGFILPFYAIIDMLESAINVWSDACVTAISEKKMLAANKNLVDQKATPA